MVSLWHSVLILLAPLFLIRSFILNRALKRFCSEKSYGYKIFYFFFGSFQDVLVIFQVIFLGLLLKNFIEVSSVIHGVLSLIYTAIILDCFVDAFLYHSTQLRLEAPFLAFTSGIKCFWDSAKERKIAWLFPLLGIGLTVALAFFYVVFERFSYDYTNILFLASFVSLGLSVLSQFIIPKKISYGLDNAFFAQQWWLIKRLYYFLRRISFFKKFQGHAKKEILQPSNEKYFSLSSRYPLLKYTSGFYGEKQCEINLEEGSSPHIVLLFLESFRAKDVGSLGGSYNVTPNFDNLAKQGYLFSNFYANSVKTTRAVSSTLFGIPSDINSSEISSRIDMPFISLAYLLSKHGYKTLYHHNGLLEFENQIEFFSSYGYQELIGRDEIIKKYPYAPLTSWGVHDEYLMNYSASKIEQHINSSSQPLFMTMFTISNHHPWTLPESMRKTCLEGIADERYEKFLYTMNYSDYALGQFISKLREKKLTKDIVFFILGDHGYPMGEHLNNHIEQRYLYDENLKVPLLVLSDGKIKTPKVIDDLGSQIDLIPTIMDLCNLKGLNHARGTSLLRKAKRQVFFHNPYAYRFYGTRKGSYKLIYTKSSNEIELYDLTLDPEEKNDISKKMPNLAFQYLQDVKDYHEYYKSLYDSKRFSPFELEGRVAIVDFSKLSKYSSNRLLSEIKKYPFILHLDLSHCDLLTDETLESMLKPHSEIQSLNLANCHMLTSTSLKGIAKHCLNLKFIDVSNCMFSDEDIDGFSKNALQLEKLKKSDKKQKYH